MKEEINYIWVPCQVTEGDFPSERTASINIDGTICKTLIDKNSVGDGLICLAVEDISERYLKIRVPGYNIAGPRLVHVRKYSDFGRGIQNHLFWDKVNEEMCRVAESGGEKGC